MLLDDRYNNLLFYSKYKAAEQDDLWRHLTDKAHEDGTLPKSLTVKTIMDTWTLQMGFPVLTVNRKYDSNSAELSQERFLLADKSAVKDDDHDYMWWIPVSFAEPGLENFKDTYNKIWMSNTEKTKTIKGLPARDVPVIFNIQQSGNFNNSRLFGIFNGNLTDISGYFRVNYDVKNWKLIIQQLERDHTQIHVINRAQLIDDALNLARVGLLDYKLALGVTSYLKRETEYIPWKAALGNLSYLRNMLSRSSAYGDFKVRKKSSFCLNDCIK